MSTPNPSTSRRWNAFRRLGVFAVLVISVFVALNVVSTPALAAPAQTTPVASVPTIPQVDPVGQAGPGSTDDRVSIDLNLDGIFGDSGETNADGTAKPSKSILILVTLTLLSVVPSLLVCMTSFTRIVVVLSIARNAIGLQSIPPNQVITGLALFLSLFVMAPTIKEINDNALQPYLRGEIEQSVAFKEAEGPIKDFMLSNTRDDELSLMIKASDSERPDDLHDLSLMTVIPAFILSELKSAFIIGVMVLLPFLVIDLVVSAGLMSLGMMMLPPTFVSLPFKLLLFVMVDGWALIAQSLIANFK